VYVVTAHIMHRRRIGTIDDAGCCHMRALCITHAHRGVVQRRRADVVVVLIRRVSLPSAAGFRALQCELMFAAAGPPGLFTAGSCSCWIFVHVWDVAQRSRFERNSWT